MRKVIARNHFYYDDLETMLNLFPESIKTSSSKGSIRTNLRFNRSAFRLNITL